jgi:hypothetical protein
MFVSATIGYLDGVWLAISFHFTDPVTAALPRIHFLQRIKPTLQPVPKTSQVRLPILPMKAG